VGELRIRDLLPSNLPCQDSYSPAVSQPLRTVSQPQQSHVVWRLGNHWVMFRCLHNFLLLDVVLLHATARHLVPAHSRSEVLFRRPRFLGSEHVQHSV